MPELPEVERAAALIRSVAKGKTIHHVESYQDELVYSRVTHHEFAAEIAGRAIRDAARYGKYFYIQLDGSGRMPVLHFGMTGMLKVRGQLTPQYKANLGGSSDGWPPRFVKFILFIQENDSSFTELAFCDARRLGRIRMAFSPLREPPISDLGFDPILSMPSLRDFRNTVSKRTCPIKVLLLDQSFSAGIGNYLADEILYQARVHPEQRCSVLDESQTLALHQQIADVCRITVEANADDAKYPDHWLFHHRWGKGKKKIKQTMRLPSGEPATIKWITVGGRTSAYIAEVQKPSLKRKNRDKPPEGRRIRAAIRILDADAPKGVALPEISLMPEDVKISAWDRVVTTAPHQTDTHDELDLLRIWHHVTFKLVWDRASWFDKPIVYEYGRNALDLE